MDVYLVTTGNPQNENLDKAARTLLESCQQRLRAATHPRYRLAETAESASIILYIESPHHKFAEYADVLRAQEPFQRFPNRCFAYDWEDGPPGFLSGVYPSMSGRKVCSQPLRYASAGFLLPYNELAESLAEQRNVVQPELLYSFRGSASSEVRRKLFAASLSGPNCPITQTEKWFTHDESDKANYVEEMLNSKAVLCPRGVGHTSFRVFETMALGRVPVVFSDDWAIPSGIPWHEFAICIAEDRYQETPEILRQYEPFLPQMGEMARLAWEQNYAPELSLFRVLEIIEAIMLRRGKDYDESRVLKQWRSWEFAWENEWTIVQRGTKVLKEGSLLTKVKRAVASRTKNP